MMHPTLKHARNTALTLMGFAALFTLLLNLVYTQTLAPIADSEAQARMALFQQIVPASLFDNTLLSDTQTLPVDPLLGNSQPITANIARLQGKASAVIFEVTAHDGYSGDIKLLLAVRANGQLAGVRVLSHKETPGLGDYIDIAKDRWITLFDGLSLQAPIQDNWKVKKDGGDFDYRAGATITPRAVVGAVARALEYVSLHQTQLFADSASAVTQGNTSAHSVKTTAQTTSKVPAPHMSSSLLHKACLLTASKPVSTNPHQTLC